MNGGYEGRALRAARSDNALVNGTALTDYYASHPAMDSEGTTVFWGDGKLLAVDKDLAGHEMFAMDDSRDVLGRTLLLDEGSVAISYPGHLLSAHLARRARYGAQSPLV
ncbi:hypothetical protein ACWGHM_36650 [Streptomyces sp. NPDC054904]|uniref:hypothetical protein n=1 Tax=Streptomyces sp. NPDC017949 TaxID=3365020 RepID=UPI0037A2DA4C